MAENASKADVKEDRRHLKTNVSFKEKCHTKLNTHVQGDEKQSA